MKRAVELEQYTPRVKLEGDYRASEENPRSRAETLQNRQTELPELAPNVGSI